MTQVAVTLQRATAQLEAVSNRLDDARASVGATQASMNVTIGELQQTDAERDDMVQIVKQRGVTAYTRSASSALAVLDVDTSAQFESARQYSQAAARVDTTELSRLNSLVERLQLQLASKAVQHDDAIAQRDVLEREHRRLVDEVEEARQRLADAGAVPVMGASQLTSGQLAAWFASTGVAPRLQPGTTMDDVTAMFIEEGRDENVRGDLAFAQAIIETGSFTVAAGNNFSGIGVCDSCASGYGFTTPRDGVRAQIQLLRNYADPESRSDRLAHAPSPSLYGSDPQRAARLYDTFFLKGKAPLWNLMGNGNWATDPVYAPKVVSLYNQMVTYVNSHPELGL